MRGVIVLVWQRRERRCLAEALSLDGTEAGFARHDDPDRARRYGDGQFPCSPIPAAGPLRVSACRCVILGILADRFDHRTFRPSTLLFCGAQSSCSTAAPLPIPSNRNPVLSLGIGADGLKTGHTSKRRVLGLSGRPSRVIAGSSLSSLASTSAQARAEEAEKDRQLGVSSVRSVKDVVQSGGSRNLPMPTSGWASSRPSA